MRTPIIHDFFCKTYANNSGLDSTTDCHTPTSTHEDQYNPLEKSSSINREYITPPNDNFVNTSTTETFDKTTYKMYTSEKDSIHTTYPDSTSNRGTPNNKPDAQHTLENEVNPVNAATVQITGRRLMVVHGVNHHMRYYTFNENKCTIRKKKYYTSRTYTNKTTIMKENVTNVDTTMEHNIPSTLPSNTLMNNDQLYIQML